MSTKGLRFLTFDQKMQAMELFKANMHERRPGSETYAYNEGWSDERVAREVGASSIPQISAWRQDRGFKLQTGRYSTNGSSSKNEIKELKHRVTDLSERIDERIDTILVRLARVEGWLDLMQSSEE